MKYSVNWTKGKKGNEAKEGDIIKIQTDADYLIWGVYKNNLPVIIGQVPRGHDSFKLKRSGMSLKGKAVLKVTGYTKDWSGSGIKDEFEIV